MTEFTAKSLGGREEQYELTTDIVPAATEITIDRGLRGFREAFVAFEFFSADDETAVATPTAGTVDNFGRLSQNSLEVTLTPAQITVNTDGIVTVGSPLARLRFAPAGITGATHWRAVITLVD